jgi:hypothetical protein
MSKRSREGEEEVADAPDAKHARFDCGSGVFMIDLDAFAPCHVFTLVHDTAKMIASLLDPLSQRAFCCASNDALALMQAYRSDFPLPPLKHLAAAPYIGAPFEKQINSHRHRVAKWRTRILCSH